MTIYQFSFILTRQLLLFLGIFPIQIQNEIFSSAYKSKCNGKQQQYHIEKNEKYHIENAQY